MAEKINAPSLHDLVQLIHQIRTTPLAPVGTVPGVASASKTNPMNAVNLALASNPATNQLATQEAMQGRGKSFLDLPYDVKALIESKNGIQESTGPVHRGFWGTIGHDITHYGGEALARTADVLSRPMYASADAFKGMVDAAESSNDSFSPGALLRDFITAPAQGAIHGLSGTDKSDYSDVIQHIMDIQHAKDHGHSAAQAEKIATEHPGIAHVNPFLKGGMGLTADIVLDPTTYIGTGLIGKVLQGATRLETAGKAAELASKAEKLGVKAKDASGIEHAVTNTEMAKTLGLGAPYKYGTGEKIELPIKKLLTDAQHSAKLRDSEPLILDYAQKAAESHFNNALETARTAIERDDPLPFDATVAQKAARESLAKQEATNAVGSIDTIRETTRKELVRLTTELMQPDIQRRLGVKFAGKKVGSIPYENLAKLVEGAKASNTTFGKSMTHFDKLFRNSAGVHPDLNGIRLRSGVGERIRGLNHQWRQMYKGTSRDSRVASLDAWGKGLKNSVYRNASGEDINKKFSDIIGRIQSGFSPEIQDLFSPSEMNRYLPKSLKFSTALASTASENLDRNWLEKFIKNELRSRGNPVLRDPAYIVHHMQVAYEKAIARKSMLHTIGETFGHSVRQDVKIAGNSQNLRNKVTQDLIDNHGYRGVQQVKPDDIYKKINVPYLPKEKVVFEPEVAKGIEKLLAHTDSARSGSQFEKYFDRALYEWKSIVTKYNPGYHERNLYGEMFNNFLAGVHDATVYKAAAKVLRGRDRKFINPGDSFEGATRSDIKAANAQIKNASRATTDTQVAFRRTIKYKNGKTVTQNVSPDEVWHLYVENGLKTGFIATDLDKALAAKNKVGEVVGRVNEGAQHLTENVEDFARVAHFIDGIKKSKFTNLQEAAREASADVRKFHFDYSDYTKFEKNVMSRIFPFYKWTRKNIPLMLEMTLAKPGKVIIPLKIQRSISNMLGYQNNGHMLPPGDFIMPSWLSKDLATPVGNFGGSNTTYVDPPLPWEQAFQTLQSPMSTMEQMANPIAQLVAEATLHKNLTGQATNGPTQIFANQTPMSKFIANLVSGGSQGKTNAVTLAQFLTGLGFMENTPNRMKAEAKAEQQSAVSQRKKYEQQAGLTRTTNHPGMN